MLKEATIHFCLFHESHFSNICTLQYVTIEYIENISLRQHRKKVRNSQASISVNCNTELSKTQFYLLALNFKKT